LLCGTEAGEAGGVKAALSGIKVLDLSRSANEYDMKVKHTAVYYLRDSYAERSMRVSFSFCSCVSQVAQKLKN